MKVAVVCFAWWFGCMGASEVDCANNPSVEVCAGRDGLESLFQSNKPILESLNLAQNGQTLTKICEDIDCGALQKISTRDESHGWCEDVSDTVSEDYFGLDPVKVKDEYARRWITRTKLDESSPFGKYYCETEMFDQIDKDNVNLQHSYKEVTGFDGDMVLEGTDDIDTRGVQSGDFKIHADLWYMWINKIDDLKAERKKVANALGPLRYWKHCLSVCCVADGCWRFMQRPQYKNEPLEGDSEPLQGYNFYWQTGKSEFPAHYTGLATYGASKGGPGLWRYAQQYCYEEDSKKVFCPFSHVARGEPLTPGDGVDPVDHLFTVHEHFVQQVPDADPITKKFGELCCKEPAHCAGYAHANDWMNAGVEIEWQTPEDPEKGLIVATDAMTVNKALFARALYEAKLWVLPESFINSARHQDYYGKGRNLDR